MTVSTCLSQPDCTVRMWHAWIDCSQLTEPGLMTVAPGQQKRYMPAL